MTSPPPAWIRAFSHPVAAAPAQVFDTIAAAHGVSVVSQLLARQEAAIRRSSTGLADCLAAWAAGPVDFATVWDIAFGRALLALKEGRLPPADVAARLGLRLAEQGCAGSWTAEVAATPYLVGGLMVPDVVRLDAALPGDGTGRLLMRQADGGEVMLSRDVDGTWHGDGVRHLRRVGGAAGFVLLPGGALPDDEITRNALQECQPVGAVTDPMADAFAQGMALLQELVPDYVPWVTRVIHGVVVCAIDGPYHLVSGSWEDIPGYIHLSWPHVAVDMAETLVHEAAHQYFYLLERVGPIDDGSDAALYWSPPIRRNRPLSRVLMAFHALVNALEVYRAVLASDRADRPYAVVNEPALRAAVETLNRPLQDNAALTRFGRGLYEPLAALVETAPA